MIPPYLKKISILLIYSFLFCDDASIEKLNNEKDKIERDIKQKDHEIETLNKELELIRKKITNTTSNLNTKTKQAIKGQKDLIEIQKEIERIDIKLLEIEAEIKSTDILIYTQKKRIENQEIKIDSIELIIDKIIFEFKKRAKNTYRSGLKEKTNWKEKKYLKKLNQYADKTDLNKEEKYLSELLVLDKNKSNLETALKELEITLISKKKLLDFKKKTKQDLIKNKDKKRVVLSKLKIEKEQLENELSDKKNQENKKETEIKLAQQLIKKLFEDKENNKKRTEDLIKIRLEQNKEISGNFNKMKGKLQWPVDGKIIAKYGNQINPNLNTVTENTGIEIQCNNNSKVSSVMDGIIMTITYIPTYGNMIIIDHGDEYSTVYANVDEILVYEDEYVSKGTVIAKVSRSGQSKKSLHFEIWHKSKTQNPESWLIRK